MLVAGDVENFPHVLGFKSARGNFSTMAGCGTRSTSLWVGRILFWQLSRDRNLHGLGMSHATTVSPKPTFRAPWRVGDTVVGRGNAGWTTSKSGHPCHCQNCSQWPPVEKTGRGSVLNLPLCPPDDPVGQGTELNLPLARDALPSYGRLLSNS